MRKSTIEYPRYQSGNKEYMKFVIESTPRKIYPKKDDFSTMNAG